MTNEAPITSRREVTFTMNDEAISFLEAAQVSGLP